MTTSKNINSYSHVKNVLDAALQHGEVVYELPSSGDAHRWRMEAHAFRKLASAMGDRRYDGLILRLSGAMVEIRPRRPVGILRTPTGQRLDILETTPLVRDPIEEEIEALGKKLFGEVDPIEEVIPSDLQRGSKGDDE